MSADELEQLADAIAWVVLGVIAITLWVAVIRLGIRGDL